jgi:2-methylcitrate dehydratase
LKGGKEYALEKEDYYGFHTRPLSWADVKKKFRKLSQDILGKEEQKQVIDVIENFQKHSAKDLVRLLGRVGKKVETLKS